MQLDVLAELDKGLKRSKVFIFVKKCWCVSLSSIDSRTKQTCAQNQWRSQPKNLGGQNVWF